MSLINKSQNMAAERGVGTLSVGLRSGVRLWLARVMHSSKVLMKVAQVALSREACRRNEHKCCRRSFQDPNVTLFRWKRRCATSTVGVASVSAGYCVWMVWTCWTRRSQYRRTSDIFVFRPSGPADTCRIASAEGQMCIYKSCQQCTNSVPLCLWPSSVPALEEPNATNHLCLSAAFTART